MANIFDVEPPRWLQEIARPIDTAKLGSVMGLALAGATNAARGDMSFAQGVQVARKTMADPNWESREAMERARVLGTIAQSQAAWQRYNLQAMEEAAWLKDLPAISEHAAKPIEEQLKQPLGGLNSKRGNSLAVQMNRAASSSAVAKSMEDSKATYDKRVAAVIKNAPDLGSALALGPSQFPDQMKWRILQNAEMELQLRQENRATMAEIEALQRGDEISTTIDEEGKVTRSFKPTTSNVKPEELTLSGGERIVYNPKGGGFRLIQGEKEKELTPSQLADIAKQIKVSDKATAKKIEEFLAGKASKQIEGAKTPPKSTAAPPGGINWKDYEKWLKAD